MNTPRDSFLNGCVVVAAVLAGVWFAAESRAQSSAPTPSIAGAWTLNRDLSDKPQDPAELGPGERRGGGTGGGGGRGRGGGMGRGGGGGMGRGGRMGGMNPEDAARMREAMRAVVDAPDHLTITQAESMVVITTGDGGTTRLSLDGKKIKDLNTRIERQTRWVGGKLVSEISGLGPGKITETYCVDPERRQLDVRVQVESSRAPQPTTMNRVYDADAAVR